MWIESYPATENGGSIGYLDPKSPILTLARQPFDALRGPDYRRVLVQSAWN